jgi:hypothetical protein
MNLQKINNQKNHGQTENKEQRDKNNQRHISQGSSNPWDYRIRIKLEH